MGVHGLWKLIEPAGKPVPVETLDNKVLAVDVSIWLHQLMKGYQNPGGSNLSNAYLLGLFTRVCKLLFTNIKPIFVFDGGVPQLKRKTIAARQQQRNKAEQASEKVREQLLKNLLKQKAVGQVLEEIRGQTSPKKKAQDMFELPPLPEAEESEAEEMSESSSEEDVKPVKMKYKDLHTINVNSADFKALPADMRHDILTELKETRKQNSWGRLHEMPEESGDFSKYQMSRLLKRRSVQVSLEEAEKEMGGRTLSLGDVEALLAEGGIEINPQLSKRIASDDVTRYIYVSENQDKSNPNSKTYFPSSSTSSTKKEETSDSKGIYATDVKIKEEIISSDELSDTELLREVETIETVHGIIKEERNEEFGTEDMFEEDSSSEGVIIDDFDLVKDNSGLSQQQILEVIKQQNKKKPCLMHETEIDLDKDKTKIVEENVVKDTTEETKLVKANMLKTDNFKLKIPKSIKNIVYKKNKEKDLINKTDQKLKDQNKKHIHLTSVDLSAMASDSSDDEEHSLPCEISEIVLPNPVNTPFNNIANKMKSDNVNKLAIYENTNLETPAEITSTSSSDDELLEVGSSDDIILDSNDSKTIQGLQIEVQTNKTNIEDDIFADIFSSDHNKSIDLSPKVLLVEGHNSNNTNIRESSKFDSLQHIKNKLEYDLPGDTHLTGFKPTKIAVNLNKYIAKNIVTEEKDKSEKNILIDGCKKNKMDSAVPNLVVKKEIKPLLPKKITCLSQTQYKKTAPPVVKESINIVADKKKNKKMEKYNRIMKTNPIGIFDPMFDSEESDTDESLGPALPENDMDEAPGLVSPESTENLDESVQKLMNNDAEGIPEELSSFNEEKDAVETMLNPQMDDDTEIDSVCKSSNSVFKTQEKTDFEPTPGPSSSDIVPQEKPKRTLDSKNLEKLQEILESKERELVVEQNREDRVATSITDQMYQDAQELLRLFGVPYVVAPLEAEAQCAFMDAAGLTQGTVTDDSDIWLFGGQKVYKNFFDQKKFVMEFQADNIHHYFKLSRNHLVLLALLVGSDYTVGLQGVGAVTALEILATFPPPQTDTRDPQQLLSSLLRFKQWLNGTPLTHTPLAKKLRNVGLHQGFPSPAVVSAYLDPLVDDSREPFSWGEPDLPALRDYAERKFGWNRNRTDQILLPVVNKLSQKTSQLTLHTFFGAVPNITAQREKMSRRVQSAVNRLDGGSEDFVPAQPRARGQGRGRGRSEVRETGISGRGRGRATLPADDAEYFIHSSVGKAPEVIPQREKDRQEALKRKQQAVEVLKNKKSKGIKKRKNVRQEKPEANLSESSSDD